MPRKKQRKYCQIGRTRSNFTSIKNLSRKRSRLNQRRSSRRLRKRPLVRNKYRDKVREIAIKLISLVLAIEI